MKVAPCSIALTLLLAANLSAQSFNSTFRNPYEVKNSMEQSVYWGYSGDPYLVGAARVIEASGKLMISTQQARLMQEDVKSAKLDNRRKRLEQWLWERDNLPTPEDDRRRLIQEQLRRSRFNPPLTEIWSGGALNDLLLDLANVEEAVADRTPINADILEKVNLTTGKGSGNIGFLKGDLTWQPQLLADSKLAGDATRLVRLVSKAAEQAPDKHASAEQLRQMIQLHRKLRDALAERVRHAAQGEFTPAMYIDAKTYLDQINDVIKVLQRPDAARYFDTRYAAKAKTVGELVYFMKSNGLRFAQATNGSEDAYTALHHALAGVSQRMGSSGGKPK